MNRYLSIVIPTFNRSDFLNLSLEIHVPLLMKYNIPVFILDNASTDNTKEVVGKWMKVYKYIFYNLNSENIGPVANFELALNLPESDYVWLLSDTYKIPEKAIDYVIDNCGFNYDFITFNLASIISEESKVYTNPNQLLHDLGALMTCAAVNVYSKSSIVNASFGRYRNSSFIQTGIIFEAFVNKNVSLSWCSDISIEGIKGFNLSKKNWSNTKQAFEIGCEDWTNFVMSLPCLFTLKNKFKCIMEFGIISKLFTIKNIIYLRSVKLLNLKVFYCYKNIFRFVINYPLWLIFLISITPVIFLKIIIYIYKKVN